MTQREGAIEEVERIVEQSDDVGDRQGAQQNVRRCLHPPVGQHDEVDDVTDEADAADDWVEDDAGDELRRSVERLVGRHAAVVSGALIGQQLRACAVSRLLLHCRVLEHGNENTTSIKIVTRR